MDNEKLIKIWQEIERIARSDREYINSLPDTAKLNDKLVSNYDKFLKSHF